MKETPTFVKKLTTTFIKYIGPPAAIAALLFGAIAIHKTKWFWMIIGIIFLIAFFTTILPTVKLWKMYITNYRTVKSKLDQLENENEKFKENENLQELLPSFEESVLNARSSGILEGRAQIEGAIYAIRSPIPIIASAELQDGEIIIL